MNSRINLAILFFGLICQLIVTNAQFRIKNGENARIKQNAHSIAIFVDHVYICVGSLVNPRSVITAAHCVAEHEQQPDKITLRAGVANINGRKGQRRKVASIHYDCDYDEETDFMDIAVVKAAKRFHQNVRVEPVLLCNAELTPGTMLQVSGWGSDTAAYNNVLQTTEMPIVEINICKLIYAIKPYPRDLSETLICAGCGVSDTCRGDSGAGGLVNGRLCAVVVSGCAYPGIPSLFTNLTNEKVQEFIDRWL